MGKLTREQWLAERRKGIGGSDAAAIVGMNHYVTPYMLWADKTGRLPEKPDNEAMRQGRDLEQYVADRFMEETGHRVRRHSAIIRNPEYPFAHANIDRAVVGEPAGLECKTTSLMNLKKFRNGEFPENYYVQCVHYLAVTGLERWYLGVVILNQGFKWFTIERDQAEIDALMQAEKDFWNTYVAPDVPPPVDGLPPTSEALESVFPGAGCDEVKPIDRADVVRNYFDLKEQIAVLQKEKERCEQIFKQDLGDGVSGECGDYRIDWKPQTRQTFDFQAFCKDHPELDLKPYLKESSFRRFAIRSVQK